MKKKNENVIKHNAKAQVRFLVKIKDDIRYSPILPLRFRSCTRAALSVLIRDIITLSVWCIFVLENVPDAEVQTL